MDHINFGASIKMKITFWVPLICTCSFSFLLLIGQMRKTMKLVVGDKK